MIKILVALALIIGPISAQADVVEITTLQEHQALVNQAKPMIIMFGADWCGYCREAKPEFIKAEKLYKGKVIFAYMDTDINRVEGLPFIPSYVMSDITGQFRVDTLNKNQSRDVKGLVEYIKEHTGVTP